MIIPGLADLAVPVADLALLPGNPRRGDVDAVVASLDRFGQRRPIVVRRDGTVVAGNHTLQAARRLGWEKIAAVFVDDDDVTAQAFALADNRTHDLGGYDEVELAALIGQVEAVDPGLLADSGWSDEATAELLARLAAQEELPAVAEPDAVPDLPAVPVSAAGDVWLLGTHRLVCGDSTDPAVLDLLLEGRLADCLWTDPPYGVDYVGKTADALTLLNDARDGTGMLLRDALGAAVAVCRPGAAWYVAGPGGPATLAFAAVLAEMRVWRQTITWVKDAFVLGHSDYHYRHEIIYFGYVPGAAGRRGRGGFGWYGDHAQDTVWEIPRPRRSESHPTMKPVELITRSLENSTRPGAIVLDIFAGSGSTLLAAHLTGRVARLVELDPRYVDVICRRYQDATGDKPTLEATGEPHDFTEGVPDAEPSEAGRA